MKDGGSKGGCAGVQEKDSLSSSIYPVLSTCEGLLEDLMLITRRDGVGGFVKAQDPRFGHELA